MLITTNTTTTTTTSPCWGPGPGTKRFASIGHASHVPGGEGPLITPLAWVGKLRHREAKSLVHGHTAGSGDDSIGRLATKSLILSIRPEL